jgi:hypothetical protein
MIQRERNGRAALALPKRLRLGALSHPLAAFMFFALIGRNGVTPVMPNCFGTSSELPTKAHGQMRVQVR